MSLCCHCRTGYGADRAQPCPFVNARKESFPHSPYRDHLPQSGPGASRNLFAALREAGIDVEVVEYLKIPPDRPKLEKPPKGTGKSVRDIQRRHGASYEELGLDNPTLTDDQIFAANARHPVLIERPIVVLGDKVALCRPSETVRDLIR